MLGKLTMKRQSGHLARLRSTGSKVKYFLILQATLIRVRGLLAQLKVTSAKWHLGKKAGVQSVIYHKNVGRERIHGINYSKGQ